uniref:Uncharacterized protein n=1 Tax=Geobacillus sp. (strain WCH70) TaxID=471223 RepID=C5D6V9_GEOSW
MGRIVQFHRSFGIASEVGEVHVSYAFERTIFAGWDGKTTFYLYHEDNS